MFADNTLTPREAVRLCALGLVARAPMRYRVLAAEVRRFLARISGPSLDLMGSSIELLRYEGLVTAEDGQGMGDDALLTISAAGQRELRALLMARLRPNSDLSRLVVALKFRFLDLLAPSDRATLADMLLDVTEAELVGLEDLRADTAAGDGALAPWLDCEIAAMKDRLTWLQSFRATL